MDLNSNVSVLWVRDVDASTSPTKEGESVLKVIENSSPHHPLINKEKVVHEDSENVAPNQNTKSQVFDNISHHWKKRATYSPGQRDLAKKMFKDIILQSVGPSGPNSDGNAAASDKKNSVS